MTEAQRRLRELTERQSRERGAWPNWPRSMN